MQTSQTQQASAFRTTDFDVRLVRIDEAKRLVRMLHGLLHTSRAEAQGATMTVRFREALFGFREALHNRSLGFTPDAKKWLAGEFGPAFRFQIQTTGQANAIPKELLVLVDRAIAHLSAPAQAVA